MQNLSQKKLEAIRITREMKSKLENFRERKKDILYTKEKRKYNKKRISIRKILEKYDYTASRGVA